MTYGRLITWPTLNMKRASLEELAALDPREVPLYWLSEVALYTGVAAGTLKYWTQHTKQHPPLIRPPADPLQQRHSELRLSFSNLLEAHILCATKERKIPLARVRKGLLYLQEQSGEKSHPLLTYSFYSVRGSRDVFVRTLEGEPVNVSRHGQGGLATVLDDYLKRIEWDQSGPIRVVPIRSNRVIIDLNVSGGRPVIRGTGVLASMLASRWQAGDSYEDLARGYRLPVEDVREAVRYIHAA